MADLYLVRHGQASLGAQNYDALSPSGHIQSTWLGEYFAQADMQFDRIVTGTMRRHEQTAEALLAGMRAPKIDVVQDADLNEYNFHALFEALEASGLMPPAPADGAIKHFYKALKHALQLWSEDRLPGPLPESWQQFQARVARAREAIQRMGGKRVLAVSSGGAIAVFTQQILEAPASAAIALNMQIRNSSVSQYVFNESAMSLVGFNALPHLERAERRKLVTYG